MLTVRTTPNFPTFETARHFDGINRLMEGFFAPMFGGDFMRSGTPAMFPPLNIWHDDKAVHVEAELPGFRQEDIDVTVQNDELTIRGKREISEVTKDSTVIRRERAAGEFERTIRLPFPVESERATASFTNGVLSLSLPKPAEIQPRKIRVTQA